MYGCTGRSGQGVYGGIGRSQSNVYVGKERSGGLIAQTTSNSFHDVIWYSVCLKTAEKSCWIWSISCCFVVFAALFLSCPYAFFQRNIMFLPSQSWDIVSMLCPWARHLTLKCFTLTQVKTSTWWDRDGNVYDNFNAPKWLQDCMLYVDLKWHTTKQVQWPGSTM